MIVTTAGHIDHGKTALVKALTGTDTDRLPEERARGITIDLGFAYRRLPGGGTVGFVDVPGHERLVRTMMAGASGVDLALLAVAADDGVMPQTREHIAVLDLLGVRRALVALTKADRANAARIATVRAEVVAALADTAMAAAPVLACCSLTGDGIPAIAGAIEAAAMAVPRPGAGRFRLAVDRSFTLPGIGLVAAGAVHAGSVQVGDRLLVSPSGIEVRVRGIHVHEQAADTAIAGQRVALNLVGSRADKGSVGRGDWVVDPALHHPTRRLDVRVRLLPAEARALKHWTPVHLHLGTASVTGRVALMAPLPPGGVADAQLVLDAPVAALSGDRFALRDASAQRTIGGGRVLDPFAPARRPRDRPETLAGWAQGDHAQALAALLAASPAGLDLPAFRQARNLEGGETVTAGCVTTGSLAFSAARWAAIEDALLDASRRHHDAHADIGGATGEELAAVLAPALRPVALAALRALADAGRLRRTGQLWHHPDREIRLAPTDAVLWDDVQAALGQSGLDPPRLTMLAERLGSDVAAMQALLDRLGRIGWLHRASGAYYLLPDTAAGLAAAARQVAADSPDQVLTVGRFRERAGLSRHATMPILEYFDRMGLTRRVNEGRRICGAWPPS